MPYPIEKKLVVGVSSNALFDLHEEDSIFQNQGIAAYRHHQTQNRDMPLAPGFAFPFIRRFLGINGHYPDEQPVEVVLLSKNSPETGVRIFHSIRHHNLNISRAAFTSGESPFCYIPAYNISLFLSENEADVMKAIEAGYPAGRFVNAIPIVDDGSDELRVAFDFDGVIVDDESEQIYQQYGIKRYYEHETAHCADPHSPGILADFFKKLAFFQKLETKKKDENSSYNNILKTAIITARNAPAHERAINTLKAWDVTVDAMFLLGGIEKRRLLEVFKPHLFLDDQLGHLDTKIANIPLVHIPFGKLNKEQKEK